MDIAKPGTLIITLPGKLSEVETIFQNVSTLVDQLLPKGKTAPHEKRLPIIHTEPSQGTRQAGAGGQNKPWLGGAH